jgi:HPt (histidine-containing phosphotransfer) domain-containing protein
VPDLMGMLSVAFSQSDTGEIRRIAHKLKGNCLSVGTPRLAAICHAIEIAAQAGYVHSEANHQLPQLYARVAQLLGHGPSLQDATRRSMGSSHE